MKIETVPIDSIELDPANLRLHPERNVASIKGSLKRFGQQKPIVVDPRGIVIAGNGVLEAARSLGWKVIDITRTTLKDAEAIAFSIADNRIGELSNWDEPALAGVLEALAKEDGSLLEAVGYDEGELAALVDGCRGDVIEDETPPLPAEAVSKLGDVWLLGEHRVACGDATEAETVGRVLNGASVELLVTDPPYGVEHDTTWREEVGISSAGPQSAKGITWDTKCDWSAALEHFKGDIAYLWHAGIYSDVVKRALEGVGLEIRQQIIWRKSVAPICRGHYNWQHEPCWYAVRKSKTANWIGSNRETTVWDVPSPRHIMGGSQEEKQPHPAQKPVECMGRPIRNHRGRAYDPFLGSGTTMIAAEQLGRICYGVEIDPRYVDVTLRRWMNLTGKSPVRESDGAKFADLSPTVVPDRIGERPDDVGNVEAKGQRTPT